MPIVYTPHDKELLDTVIMMISEEPKFAGGIGDLGNIIGKNWPFQFPPRVTADSKTATWEETDRVSYEPIAYWMGAKARALTLETVYFVTGEKKWSGAEIAKIAHAAKAYFYRSIEEAVAKGGFGPIVTITALYGAVQEESTWRCSGVNVEYAPTFVRDTTPSIKPPPSQSAAAQSNSPPNNNNNKPNSVDQAPMWPLWTKITFELQSWTQNANAEGEEKLKAEALKKSPTPKWF